MYQTLAELQHAVTRASGQEPPVLTVDNDDSHAYDGQLEQCVFRMHPAELLEQALDLLGIPHQEA